jgi:hypothetical protein
MSETPVQEQRKYRRYELKLPLEIVRTGTHRISRPGETRNLSSGGVLFTAHSRMEIGEPIEYRITLHTSPGVDVRLHCKGKVVRMDAPGDTAEPQNGVPISVAATLERYEFVRQLVRHTAFSAV